MTLDEEIRNLTARHRNRIIIAAHHYQHPDIVRYADLVGDSYKLAVDSSKERADFIIMCGVLFMAEGAAILSSQGQRVVIPDMTAGCPMADMMNAAEEQAALETIQSLTGICPVPIVYMNSSAEVKAVCGRAGGAVCTSSNAEKIIASCLKEKRPVLFAPDRHLGYNTVRQRNLLSDDRIAFIGKDMKITGQGDTAQAEIFLWDGYCPVHRKFSSEKIRAIRNQFPAASVIVHPECDYSVVSESDASGSTEFLLKTVREAESGSVWAVGTEFSFVDRLAADCPDKTVFPLTESPCQDMSKITPEKLLKTLRNIDRVISSGAVLENEITLTESVSADAAKALRKMILLTEAVHEKKI